MNENLNMDHSAGVEVVKASKGTKSKTAMRGRYTMQHIRNGEVLATVAGPNAITTQGKNYMFDRMFRNSTDAPKPADVNALWYMGLVEGSGSPDLSDTDDTYLSHSTWTENTDYTISATPDVRGTWTPGAAASGASIFNTSQVVFDMDATASIFGLFIVGGDASAIGHSDATATNILWASAAFDQGATSVISGDQLKITYTVSA